MKPIIYQLLPRLFGNGKPANQLVAGGSIKENGSGHLCDINTQVLGRLKRAGVTHVWYTGVIRHATCTDYSSIGIPRQHPAVVKGKAGSPYAICDYFDIDPDLASRPKQRMAEFEKLIERTHKAGLKVVIDFVPNHVARQYKSIAQPKNVTGLGANDNIKVHFSPDNSFYYYPQNTFSPQFPVIDNNQGAYIEFPAKATGNDCFTPSPGKDDWYETAKLNYGIDYTAWGGPQKHFSPTPITWKKMKRILLFWAEKGVDAFRCDMAEMVPPEFWAYAISAVKKAYPNITFIAEVYTPSLYETYIESGFDWLYDKVGMYDSLRGVICGHLPATDITRQWQSTDHIRQHMLYFLENHDEQRIASDFFAGDARKGIPAAAVALLMGNNPFMLYSGQEVGERGMDAEGFSGQDGRTTIFDYWALTSLQHAFFNRSQMTGDEKSLEERYHRLMKLAQSDIVTKGAFFDLMYVNPSSDVFDSHRHYAFLRSLGKETMLVVANFSAQERNITVNIPDHAYTVLGIDKDKSLASNPNIVTVHVKPYDYCVIYK